MLELKQKVGGFSCAKIALPLVVALSLFGPTFSQARSQATNPFLAAAWDKPALEGAIEGERPSFRPPPGVTGITVPHHLRAADLIARGFWAASANSYDRILLIAPDHLWQVKGNFAVVQEDLETVFGRVPTDARAVAALLAEPDLFEVAADVPNEHGIMAVAPYIGRFFPEIPIVAIIASVDSMPQAWGRAAAVLESLVTDATLVVQSADYAHDLPLSYAIRRDQESLAVIGASDLSAVGGMLQPGHMDSLAAQYIQILLQEQRLGSRPVIVANRRSPEYATEIEPTTTYIVTVYVRDPAAGSVLRYGDQDLVYFAGDTLLGRFLKPVLVDGEATRVIVDTVLAVTKGAPLIVNLEGVLLDGPLIGAEPRSHVMEGAAAITLLHRLNVVAASLANNHSRDLGRLGFEESRKTLARHSIVPLVHGKIHDFGAFRVLPLSFLPYKHGPADGIETPADPRAACESDADPPLVAFVHWGAEYGDVPGDAEREAALRLNECGVSLIVGAHSHQAARGIEALAGGAVQLAYSLGNFLFDQLTGPSSGALLELRLFRQGTVAARPVPIPNLFELGMQHKSATP